MQIAGVPDRAEPDDSNEVNYTAILNELERIKYPGLVDLEYKPRVRTEDGLASLAPLSAKRSDAGATTRVITSDVDARDDPRDHERRRRVLRRCA